MPQPACAAGARHPSPKFNRQVYQDAAKLSRAGQSRTATMKAPAPCASEDPMEYGTASHLLLWVIGLIAAAGTVGTVLAFWTLGRQAYRKS